MTTPNQPMKWRTPQLPLWPDRVRGGPNAILRSALFAGIASKKRQILGTQTRPEKKPEGVTIAAQDGIKIKYSGVQFNQYDADVFFEALHRARREPLDTECRFSGAEFLKNIGRSRNNLNYEDLDESLDRLRRGSLDLEYEVNGRRYVFSGSLVASYVRETTTKLYKVTFAKEIQALFMPATWTQIEWDERMALMGKPLAQWLHSYFSTHAKPYPVSAAYLQEKSGSPTKLLKHFKTELKRAFAAMHETIGWEFSWDGDLVILKRPPSEAQGRHLARKAAKRQALASPAAAQRGGELTGMGELLPGLLKDLKRKNRRQ
jgi:TrfA protein